MDIRKIWPEVVNGAESTLSHTQPVPSIAAWRAGSARTANTASAEALMTLVALTLSSAIVLPLTSCVGTGSAVRGDGARAWAVRRSPQEWSDSWRLHYICHRLPWCPEVRGRRSEGRQGPHHPACAQRPPGCRRR